MSDKKFGHLKVFISAENQKHNPLIENNSGSSNPYSEKPARIKTIREALKKLRLIDFLQENANDSEFENQLLAVHSTKYVSALRALSESVREDDEYLYPDVFPKTLLSTHFSPRRMLGYYSIDAYAPIGKYTWQAARQAAKTAYAAAVELRENPEIPVYALVRPPGHHAGPDYMGGYCYLNNTAVAVKTLAINSLTAILDLDYHHGNGTQEIFQEDGNVLFISIHCDTEEEYPEYSGGIDENDGLTINYPLPPHTTGAEYLSILQQAIATIREFEPEYLVISLGVDTYKEDPTGTFHLDTTDYRQIGELLADTGIPLLFIQEGGYNLDKAGIMVAEVLSGACQI